MMERLSGGDLMISMWMTSDVQEIKISETSYWFNTSCSYDSLVLFRLDKNNLTIKSSREICPIQDSALYQAHNGNRMKIDSQDRLWLFLGN